MGKIIKSLLLPGKLSALVFNLAVLFFIIAFNFSDNPRQSGWYQQFLPPINNRPISDITFLDSLTGFAVTPYTANDTSYILKTINGGDNWNIVFKGPTNIFGGFNKIQFLNLNTGYVCGNFLRKTTNSGLNWFNINTSGIFPLNMYVLNEDTIWLIDDDGLTGGVYRTTNGGLSWTQQINLGAGNPDRIYMFNARIGFISRWQVNSSFYRTTNGGTNWFLIVGESAFNDIYFIDSLTGWKAGPMKKTTNGGLNWITQTMPTGGYISTSGILRFTNINKDTIWGCGGTLFYPGQGTRAFLLRTTNQGDTWYFQIPDTSYQIVNLSFIDFVNKNVGWSYRVGPNGIHTTNGGDTTFYLPVNQISSEVPKEFKLFQNYPNPFNSSTKIKFQISKLTDIKLKVFDITGRLLEMLVNERLNSGEYEISFEAKNHSSGVYFYSLFTDARLIETKKMILTK